MYKDKDKQKQASKEAMRRYREAEKLRKEREQGITSSICVIPKVKAGVIPKCWCCGDDIPVGTVCCGPCAWTGRAKVKRAGGAAPSLLRRGKDIKTFENLPPDVQQSIEAMSQYAEDRGGNKAEDKTNRTARAIRYQHLFPDRYYSTGIT